MAAAACKTSSTLSLAKPSALASAPTTTSTPSHLTPPLPLTVFLTKDSPMFCGLQQQLDNQVSTLSDIATSLQQLLASLHNPKPWLPQPPSSQPVAATLASTTLPAANTAGLHNPDSLLVDNKHKHAVLVNGVLIKSVPSTASTSSTRHFTKLIPDIRCFAEAWTVYTCIRACATNNPNLGAGLGAFLLHIIQTNCMHMWPLVASYVLTTC
ncbi:hypothetical protein NDA13_004198 [Ustilago tritici]|nr:hypothetical protein NDA13_004198 [Ustilago tritici]